ncbi:hypothetical protein TPHA_0F02770 [Tetrapisispora phaffii CBS 4417]|uniref:Uncharacterized protein n=1 Tax=Tetrapisispora phaffii (strain ATCC 24235 / CBS 4417 / NBRC 1672 / NRRL Y-8282 / UCD 70-5) TaxID=1071381 RepID=G8BUH1_TETPH|nr:hypothetical protein TPHA_0F02770 [Tetrapisispora phaffii CBS 4417]CCE63757.1 hypothetical protein TPHA_0F02770 [Tetrapisispora phaffii CBS 4417]
MADSHFNPKKYNNIDDALKYVNEQLSLKGYFDTHNGHTNGPDSNMKLLQLNNSIDDNKLIINTINKLLQSINTKNKQLEQINIEKNNLQDRLEKEIKEKTYINEKLIQFQKNTTHNRGNIQKPVHNKKLTVAKDSKYKNDLIALQKYSKINVNKLQNTIDELRNSLLSTKMRKSNPGSNDLTWKIDKDITTKEDIQKQDTAPQEHVYKKYHDLIKLRLELVKFLNEVNKLTYQKNIHHFTRLNIDFIETSSIDEENSDSTKFSLKSFENDPEVYELITDFIEIINLTNKEYIE